MNSPRSSQRTEDVLPRRAMSSEKEVSRDSFCSTRAGEVDTKDPDPCFCTIIPSPTRSSKALRTVTREKSVMLAISRSGGSGLPGARMPWATASASRLRSCT